MNNLILYYQHVEISGEKPIQLRYVNIQKNYWFDGGDILKQLFKNIHRKRLSSYLVKYISPLNRITLNCNVESGSINIVEQNHYANKIFINIDGIHGLSQIYKNDKYYTRLMFAISRIVTEQLDVYCFDSMKRFTNAISCISTINNVFNYSTINIQRKFSIHKIIDDDDDHDDDDDDDDIKMLLETSYKSGIFENIGFVPHFDQNPKFAISNDSENNDEENQLILDDVNFHIQYFNINYRLHALRYIIYLNQIWFDSMDILQCWGKHNSDKFVNHNILAFPSNLITLSIKNKCLTKSIISKGSISSKNNTSKIYINYDGIYCLAIYFKDNLFLNLINKIKFEIIYAFNDVMDPFSTLKSASLSSSSRKTLDRFQIIHCYGKSAQKLNERFVCSNNSEILKYYFEFKKIKNQLEFSMEEDSMVRDLLCYEIINHSYSEEIKKRRYQQHTIEKQH